MPPKEKGFMANPKGISKYFSNQIPCAKLIIREDDQMCHVK
jgi:hypothetical protein